MTACRHTPLRSRARPSALCAFVLVALIGACGGEGTQSIPSDHVLLRPDDPVFSGPAPESFRARFETSRGTFVVEVLREWAPLGAERFYHLVRNGFYDDARFYRAIAGFMVQFGLNGDPAVTAAWETRELRDDPVRESNSRGRVTYATAGPGTRVSEIFINLVDNPRLDESGFAPFGRVVEGMEVVDSLYAGYGEGAPYGSGPAWDRIRADGNAYLAAQFPLLDYVRRAMIEP